MKSLLREFARMYLSEAKVDVIKQKYPRYVAELDNVNRIHPKYLEWSAKQLAQGAPFEDLIGALQVFEKRSSALEKRDINAYSSLDELEVALKILTSSKTSQKKSTKTSGAEKIYERDNYIILLIKDKKASICYGSGTKWCITMSDARHYEKYTLKGVLFYFVINRNLPPENPMSKVAFAIYRNPNLKIPAYEVYDAEDNLVKTLESPYTEFLKMVQDDAASRPENPEVAALQGVRSKIDDKSVTFEEAQMYVDSLDDDEMHDFLKEMTGEEEEGDELNFRHWPVNLFRALAFADSWSSVDVGFQGLVGYRDYDTMRKAFLKCRWTHRKTSYLYKFPKQMMLDLINDELTTKEPDETVITGLVGRMDASDLQKAVMTYSDPIVSVAVNNEIQKRADYDERAKTYNHRTGLHDRKP